LYSTATTFQERVQTLQYQFFPEPPEPDLSDQEGYKYPEPFIQEPITIDNIKQAIKAVYLFKAPGITGILYLIIQESFSTTVPTITRLFQACID
jgi:hypothetical protein